MTLKYECAKCGQTVLRLVTLTEEQALEQLTSLLTAVGLDASHIGGDNFYAGRGETLEQFIERTDKERVEKVRTIVAEHLAKVPR